MKLARHAALLLAAAIAPAFPALGADYDPPVVVDAAEEFVPVEVGSGWYLRGDIGYILSQDTGRYSYRISDGVNSDSFSFDRSSLDEDFTFGGGVGYSFNEWFRADATVDGFRSDFSGSTSSAISCSGADDGTGCRSEDSADMSAISVMANGYVDLGTYVGITPYVGAGLGVSYVSWSDLGSDYYCVDGDAACASPAYFGSDSMGGQSDWRFTYALMAGASYDIAKDLKLDIGYRYKNIDGGDMFSWSSDNISIKGKDSDLSQHEIRVGLRYELW